MDGAAARVVLAEVQVRVLGQTFASRATARPDGDPRHAGLKAVGVFSGLTKASAVETACVAETDLAVVYAVLCVVRFAASVSAAKLVVGRRPFFGQRVAFGVDIGVSASSPLMPLLPSAMTVSGVKTRHKFELAYRDAA